MNKRNNLTTVGINSDTLKKLTFLSHTSCIPKTKLLQILVDQIYDVASSYEFLSFDFETSVRKSAVYIYLSGKNKLHFKTEKVIEK